MQLEEAIRNTIEEECEDYFLGFADLSTLNKDIIKHKEAMTHEYPKAISIGITMPPKIIVKLSREYKVQKEYNDMYNQIIYQSDSITKHLSNLLETKGYKTLPVLVSNKLKEKKFFSAFSHELIANLAGLGYMINNGSLITPEVGSGVLWSTIFTNAPLNLKSITRNLLTDKNEVFP